MICACVLSKKSLECQRFPALRIHTLISQGQFPIDEDRQLFAPPGMGADESVEFRDEGIEAPLANGPTAMFSYIITG